MQFVSVSLHDKLRLYQGYFGLHDKLRLYQGYFGMIAMVGGSLRAQKRTGPNQEDSVSFICHPVSMTFSNISIVLY
jgi:hypothetical protein